MILTPPNQEVYAYPNISIKLTNIELTLTPLQYFWPTSTDDGNGGYYFSYCLGLYPSYDDKIHLGLSFLAGYPENYNLNCFL